MNSLRRGPGLVMPRWIASVAVIALVLGILALAAIVGDGTAEPAAPTRTTYIVGPDGDAVEVTP